MDVRRRRIVGMALALLAVLALLEWSGSRSGAELAGAREVAAAFSEGASGVWVEGRGRLVRTLPDDQVGSAHQRFILELADGHTVLISHNIDLAPRVEGLSPGTWVAFRGQFEWNPEGGLVHWTHHDPSGTRPGGWVEAGGRRVD